MRFVAAKKFNEEALVKQVVLVGFSLFSLVLVCTGHALLYVHPRILPYIVFGAVVMLLVAAFSWKDVLKPARRKANLAPYLAFLLPLLMILVFPAASLDADPSLLPDAMPFPEGVNTAAGNQKGVLSKTGMFAVALTVQEDTVVVANDTFYQWAHALNFAASKNTGEYEGKKIQVTGFVLRNKQYKEDEFMTARLMMSCCAADLQPTGFMCRYERASRLKDSGWVKVTGKIGKMQKNGGLVPVIEVDTVEKVDKPKNAYIFP